MAGQAFQAFLNSDIAMAGADRLADLCLVALHPLPSDLAHDDLSHFGEAPSWSSGNQTLAARPASPPCLAEQPVSFAGPPGVILDGFHEVFVDGHGLLLLLIGVVSYRRRRRRGW